MFTFVFALAFFAGETDAPGAYVALTDERGDRASLARAAARRGLDDDARETLSTGRPDQGECPATRASPESTTAATPSIVTEVSATFVERISLRLSAGRTAASCSAAGSSP